MKLLLAALLLAGCSKDVTNVYVQDPAKTSDPLGTETSQAHLVEDILRQERPNVSFAKLIARSLGQDKLSIEELSELFSREEVQFLLAQTKESNNLVNAYFRFRQKGYSSDRMMTGNTISTDYASTFSFEEQLSYNAFNYLRSKSLDAIITSYTRESERLLGSLVPIVVSELLSEAPQTVKEIEGSLSTENAEAVIKRIHDSINGLEKVSRILGESNLSRGDKAALAASAALAAAIYSQVKDTKEFAMILDMAGNAQREYKLFKTKYQEFVAFRGTLDTNLEKMGVDLKSAGTNIIEAGKALRDLTRSGLQSADGERGVHSRRIVDFANAQMRRGKSAATSSLPDQYRQRAQAVTDKLQASFTAAHNAGQSLNAIIAATERMSSVIGVRIPKDIQKAMETAQKVISVVSIGKTVMDAYATGGVMTAVGIMGGSSALAGDPNAARFSEINKKLDQVLKNQKVMMEAQVETMNMIKELSIMVDRYHEREMAALAELRDLSLIQLEIQKSTLLNSDIKACEQIINYQLSSIWPQHNYHKDPYFSIGHIAMLETKVFERVGSLGDIRRMIYSGGEGQLADCHRSFTRAFGSRFDAENPLLAIFDTTESNNLMRFKRNVYAPALDLLRIHAPGGVSQAPLHLPLRSFDDLERKSLYLLKSDDDTGGFDYNLAQLISVRNLERYVSSLLLLYPLLDVRESFWEKDLSSIVAEYLDSSGQDTLFRNRSTTLLMNAIHTTQNAIAQEAILAGEPLLAATHATMNKNLLSRSECGSITEYTEGAEGAELICALRSNPLFMKNYLSFVLLKKMQNIELHRQRYSEALAAKNLAVLRDYLDADVEIVEAELHGKKRLAVKLSGLRSNQNNLVHVALPERLELEENRVQYSENMPRLMLIQEALLRHLEMTYPMTRNLNSKTFAELLRAQ